MQLLFIALIPSVLRYELNKLQLRIGVETTFYYCCTYNWTYQKQICRKKYKMYSVHSMKGVNAAKTSCLATTCLPWNSEGRNSAVGADLST